MSILNLEDNLFLQKNTKGLNEQNSAISDILNNVINWSIDAGIRYFLPNSVENQVIKIKNNLLNDNIQDKIKGVIENVFNIGKEKLNIEQNKISDLGQLEKLLKNPETIKIISETVEKILDGKNLNITNNEKVQDSNYLTQSIEIILDSEIKKQINSINKIEEYNKQWYKNYENKDFESMNNIYKKIKKELKNIVPIENVIKEAKKIENLNKLVKSKGGDFNITKEEMELANKLVY